MRVVREFREFSGLRINLQKPAGIVSNIQPEDWWSAALEGICGNPLWSRSRSRDSSSSESTVGLRGGSQLGEAEGLCEELGLQLVNSEELTREAFGGAWGQMGSIAPTME